MAQSHPQTVFFGTPRFGAGCAAFLVLCLFGGCFCEPDNTVDRRGNKIGDADTETEPKRKNHIPESEPNNDPDAANAYTLTATGPGSTAFKPFEGELSSASDIDFIKLPAQSEWPMRQVRIEPLTEGLDVAILWGVDDARQNIGGVDEAEEALNMTSGEIVVGVAAVKAAFPARYRVHLSRSTFSGGLEVEPGPEGGLPLTLPGEIQGLINHRGDSDRYLIKTGDAAAGKALRLEIQPPPGARIRAVPLVDGVEMVSFESEPGADAKPRPLVWPNLSLPVGGAVELVITGVDDAEGVRDAYTVRALLHPPTGEGELLETEPSTAATPFPLDPEGGARVLGYLHHSGDRDVFAFRVDARGRNTTILHASAEGEGLDLSIDLKTPGAAEEGDALINKARLGKAEVICNRVLLPGTTTLGLQGLRGEGEKAGLNPTGRYAFKVETREARGEEIEPNEIFAQATRLILGARATGYVYPRGDVDLYRFEIEPAIVHPGADEDNGPPMTAMSASLGGSPFDLALEVLDEDGAPVARSNKAAAGGNERLDLDLPAGIYYARVTSTSRVLRCEEPYLLRLVKR